jgi:aldehyde:ferredoxin oxidoreductase
VGTQAHGVFPTRNFQQGTFDGWEAIGGEELTRKYLVRAKPCFSCPIACGRVTRVPDGPFQGEGEGPEYETVYSLGSNCGVDDLAALTKANYLCNELGLDTISMGCAIACAMELYEKKILPEADSGMPLCWGDGHALVALTRMTAMREGFGDVLAEGSLRLATRYGRPELAMTAKGLDFAGYDPRGVQGLGLNYATSPIGGSHMRGDTAYFELLGVPIAVDPLTWEDKPPVVVKWQELIGERIFNAERLFLVAAGFDRAQDTLPPRMTREPMPSGPAKGMVCRLEEMLVPYYRLRGWTPEGVPTEEKLRALGLR